MKLKDIFELLKATFKEWSEDKASRLAAALAYYTVFSLAPMLIIIIGLVGYIWGAADVRQSVLSQFSGLFGQDTANLIDTMISARSPETGLVATIIGLATLIFGALGLFGQLHDALNTIWEVAPKPKRGILATIKDRLLSFTMVLGVGFMLLVSLILSAALSALNGWLGSWLPGGEFLAQLINSVVSFGVITLLFALIYKILPDVEIAWGDVWIGAAFTSLLFTIGKLLIGLYLGSSSTASAYGAAGSLVVLLLWVYYSAQILFFGAEFTQVYAKRFGSKIVPDEDAVALSEEARAQQGMPHAETVEAAVRGGPAPESAGRAPGAQPALRGAPTGAAAAMQQAGARPARSRAGFVGAAVFGLFTLVGVALGIVRGEK